MPRQFGPMMRRQYGSRCIEHRLLQRGAESRRDDDHGAGALLAELADQGRHGVGLGVAITASSGASGSAAISR